MRSPLPLAVDSTLPCSAQARAAHEPLAATAVGPVRSWLLIEQRQRWGRDVYSSLPATVSRPLRRLCTSHSHVRPQLIRRKHAQGPLTLFVVRSGAGIVERCTLPSLQQWTDIDWPAVLAGAPLGPRQQQPLYLVCCHSQRDRCCGNLGVPLMLALRKLPHAQVWQTSHIGGHRFAPTLLYLPHGMCYGNVAPDEVGAMHAAHLRGDLHRLDRCRGQTRLSAHAQAAALWWRQQHHHLALDAISGVVERSATPSAPQAAIDAPRPPAPFLKVVPERSALPSAHPGSPIHRIQLLTRAGANPYLQVWSRPTPPQRALSCGSDRQQPLVRYDVRPVPEAPP